MKSDSIASALSRVNGMRWKWWRGSIRSVYLGSYVFITIDLFTKQWRKSKRIDIEIFNLFNVVVRFYGTIQLSRYLHTASWIQARILSSRGGLLFFLFFLPFSLWGTCPLELACLCNRFDCFFSAFFIVIYLGYSMTVSSSSKLPPALGMFVDDDDWWLVSDLIQSGRWIMIEKCRGNCCFDTMLDRLLLLRFV